MIGPGLALLGAVAALTAPAPARCPAGMPVQAITIVNQANVRPRALTQIERATIDQSIQIRAAWGTPCVQFGPGDWVVTLQAGAPIQNADGSTSLPLAGHHDYTSAPSAAVTTGGNTMSVWARAFTHEVAEMLVDPTDAVTWRFGKLEICDPVEELTYPVDGVQVSDFALPAYFTGASGPWDEANQLAGPPSFG